MEPVENILLNRTIKKSNCGFSSKLIFASKSKDYLNRMKGTEKLINVKDRSEKKSNQVNLNKN